LSNIRLSIRVPLSGRRREPPQPRFVSFRQKRLDKESAMMKGGLLWLIGIPIPIILVLWLTGFLG
jgi:hypothetical protein